MRTTFFRALLSALLLAALAACGAPRPSPPTTVEPLRPAAQAIPDALLLDVDIAIFDAGINELDPRRDTTTPGVRRAEAHYVPMRLRDTLAASRQWGLVRVVPDGTRIVDVTVNGRILESDGRELAVEISVSDASGTKWFTRRYAEAVSPYAYDMEIRRNKQPFQNLYNRIANDMQSYLDQQGLARRETLRRTSEMRFAAALAPEAFANYVTSDGRGAHTLVRLPAENDPLLARVHRIRVRDDAFVDHLQQSYDTFDRNMTQAYDRWREESLREASARDDRNSEALVRTLGGALAVIGGILAQTSDSAAIRNAGVIGIGGGAYSVYSGMEKRAEARVHGDVLRGLSESLNEEVQPATIELTDRTIELRGSVEAQYHQWQDLLTRIYRLESGAGDAGPDTLTE
ncbi:MAG: hypothetical protein AB7Q81_02890 [Gammaproteobacteria bacterium]